VKVSPVWIVPWLWMPMMSPGQASSTFVRSWAMKIVALESTISRPIRWWNTFIPRVNFPEQILKKAIRSRWARSMFAWILKTKPEKDSSSGETIRVVVGRGPGAGAISTKASSSSRTPKLLIALPKKTGVWLPFRYSSWEKGLAAPSISAISSRSCSAWLPRSSSSLGSSISVIVIPFSFRLSFPGVKRWIDFR
jgi:hypothetical protein